jgi:two-component system cell cycle sensor histidine kinase/response regulator CckA
MFPVLLREETLLQALENSELQYRRLFETAQDGILILDASTGQIIDANPFVLDMLGYTREQLLGRRLWKIGLFKDRAMSESALATLNREGHVRFENLPLETKDGRQREVEFISNVYNADHHEVIQCNIRDITDRRHLETKVQQVEKMEAVCQLAGGVAHDYNNILMSTLLRLNLLMEDPGLSEGTRSMVRQLEGDARRAAGLTRQLLIFSRQQAICLRPLDLDSVLADLAEMLRRLLNKDVRLECAAGGKALWVEGDSVMIEQLITNLCLHAQDSMAPGGGRLAIDARLVRLDTAAAQSNPEAAPGSFVCLSVTDTSSVVNGATPEFVFEPFLTAKSAGKGTGLGMSTVSRIAKQHKAWLEVAKQVGQGIAFRVYFPAFAKSAPVGSESPASEARDRKETILVVDDEQAIRKMIMMGLQLNGYRVLEAGSGSEAIQVWEEHGEGIDLVITDMRMPGRMTGIELFEQLRRRKAALIGIISSGYSEEILKLHERMPAGLTLLPKPYDVKTLVGTVRSLLNVNRACLASAPQ